MIIAQESWILGNVARQPAFSDKSSVASDYAGRLIQITLALYLIPVLLVVLVVGGLGVILVSLGQWFGIAYSWALGAEWP